MSSILSMRMRSSPAATAATAAVVTRLTTSPRMPSAALSSFCAKAGSSMPDRSRSGSIASSVLRSRRYSASCRHGGKPNGVNRLASWSSLWMARRASAVPTATSGICSSLPSQRSRLRKRRCCVARARQDVVDLVDHEQPHIRRAQHPHRHVLLGRQPIMAAIGCAKRFQHRTKERRSSGAGGICTFKTGTRDSTLRGGLGRRANGRA